MTHNPIDKPTPHGWLVLDKPSGLSSAALVGIVKKKLRRDYGQKIKVGHAGTLDPLATGVLPLILGEATKLASFLILADKQYHFTIDWGIQTDTADLGGNILNASNKIPTKEEILHILPQFKGTIQQSPHRFSAIKVQGKRAYKLARQAQDFTLPSRAITIHTLTLLSHEGTKSHFSVTCSKGTYVRVLAEDIAKALGSYGHISRLRRTQSGSFTQDLSLRLDNLEETLYNNIVSSEDVLDGIVALSLEETQKQKIICGISLPWEKGDYSEDPLLLTFHNKIFAIAVYRDGRIHPKRILNL